MSRLLRYVWRTLLMFGVFAVAAAIHFVATLYTPGPAQRGYLVLTGAIVLVGEGLEPRTGASVIIRDGSIVGIVDAATLELPAGATVLDLGGLTLMPGLIDLHVHLGSPEREAGEDIGLSGSLGLVLDYLRYFPGKRQEFLAHGVTTVRSLGDDHGWVMEMRRMLRAGELEGPQLFAAGPMFTTVRGHPVATLGVDPASDGVRIPATQEQARQAVQNLAAGENRVDVIKIIHERGAPAFPLDPIAPAILEAIVDEAHRRQLAVVAHWGTPEDLADVLRVGVDGLQHLELRGPDEHLPRETSQRMNDGAMTLAALEAATRRTHSPLPQSALQRTMAEVAMLHAAGVRILAGSDAGMPGVRAGEGLHREIQLLARSGLSSQAALRAATSEAAKELHAERIGAIAPGRIADLLVARGDPLGRIEDLDNVVLVLRAGRIVVDRR